MSQTLASVDWSLLWQLLTAVVLGGVLGLERTLAGKGAGMRTYALVSMGSALFVIIGQGIVNQSVALGLMGVDPLHVAAQVVVGIGFIGGGMIILEQHKLRGLTTAAGLWVAAGIGMAVGFGFYNLAVFTTILTLVIFILMWYLEHFLEHKINDHE